MEFFQTIKKSIYSPEFYRRLLTYSFGAAFQYFIFLTLLISFIQVIFVVPSLFKIQKQIPGLINRAENIYPQNLVIKVKNGKVYTNVIEPYFIKMPGNYKTVKNLVVLDTKKPFTAEQFHRFNTAIWVTKDAIFYMQNTNDIRAYSLDNVKNLTIDRSFVVMVGNKIRPFIAYFTFGISILVFIGFLLLSLFRLIYLLFIALLIWLIWKILKIKTNYGQAFIVCLYAITLGVLVETLFIISSQWMPIHGFPFMFTIVTLLVVFLNYTTEKTHPKKFLTSDKR